MELFRKLAEDSDTYKTLLEIKNNQARTQAVLDLSEAGTDSNNSRIGGRVRIEELRNNSDVYEKEE